MLRKNSGLAFSLIVFIFALYVYILTLAPTVWFIDAGELASVAITLGIAHPTGYPLFTLVGHLFSKIPIGTEIYRLNFMSSFFCALGVFLMFFLMNYLMSFYSALPSIQTGKTTKKITSSTKQIISEFELPIIVRNSIIVFTCLILAFSRTYWDAANSVEVYPIHVFFLITLFLVFLKAVQGSSARRKTEQSTNFIKENKYYLIFAFILGLSFTNHLTTVLLAPACLTLFIIENRKDLLRTLKLLGSMAICFAISFSVYLYLPIRASQDPIFIWGNPVTFERFLWHITGKQFQVWIFSGAGSLTTFVILLLVIVSVCAVGIMKYKTLNPIYHFSFFIGIAIFTYIFLNGANEIVMKQFKHFFSTFWTEYGTSVVLLAIPGVYRLSKFNGKIYYFTLLTFFSCVIYSVNYDIHDIDSYFLLAYVTLSIWIGFGGLFVYELVSGLLKTKGNQFAFAVLMIIISFISLKMNYASNDESKNYFVEEYTMNVFKNAEPNSIIISSQWDFWLSASWYYHFVKNIRPDIVAIDKELLRRSWYFKFLQNRYPEVMNNSKPEIDKFLVELYKFEHNIPYDQPNIMKLFEEMLTSFVTKNPERKVYTTWEIEQNKNEAFARDYIRIPDGLLYRLVKNDNPNSYKVNDYKLYDFSFTPTNIKDYYHETIMGTYASMLTASAGFLVSTYNRTEDAKKYIDLALYAIPNFPKAMELKRKLLQP